MVLTERDTAIVRTLSTKVRVLTLAQIACSWWRDARQPGVLARKRLRHLTEARLIREEVLPAHPMLPLTEPMLSWRPEDADPDFGAVAYRLQRRWSGEYAPTRVYLADRLAGLRFGSAARGRIQHPDQTTHDLHVSALYLKLLSERPELAASWVGEDEFAKEREGEKLPDAVLKDETGEVFFVIEFGGRYDAERFRDFHLDCRERELPYDLW